MSTSLKRNGFIAMQSNASLIASRNTSHRGLGRVGYRVPEVWAVPHYMYPIFLKGGKGLILSGYWASEALASGR